MSLHLFSTPVQCTRCGTVVDDPTVDKCPKCGNLLKERRTPRRLAGVKIEKIDKVEKVEKILCEFSKF